MSKDLKNKSKIGKFYNFQVSEDRFRTVEQLSKKAYIKHFRNAFILGFLVEALVTKTRICNFYLCLAC